MQPCILCSLEYTKFNFSQWAICAVAFPQWPLHTLVMVHDVNMPIYTIYTIVNIRSIFFANFIQCHICLMKMSIVKFYFSNSRVWSGWLISRYNLRPVIRIKEAWNCVTDFVKTTQIAYLKLHFSSQLFFLILLLLFITETG